MFDLDRFVEACKAAVAEDRSHKAVREVVARAVSEPGEVLRALGAPERAGVTKIYNSDELTILNLVWGPYMSLQPHDHKMWAVIGIYTGREDNIFWRRCDEAGPGRIEAAGAKALGEKDAAPLGRDVIHSVLNPIPRLTGALHVYGGDFFGPGRSEWDPESLVEGAYDVGKTIKAFEDSNARFGLS